MGLDWVPGKHMERPEQPTNWYENANDPDALARVYGSRDIIPTYDYPAFQVNEQGNLVQDPEYTDPRYQAFKVQFDLLCDKLVTLKPENAAAINTFRAKLLCGYSGDKSSKYSHQEAKTFSEIKQNLEVVINHIIKNNDKVSLEQVMYAITVCEGGAYEDLNRLSKSFTEPQGIKEFLEKERSRIIDGLAQQHIAEAAKQGRAIAVAHLAHVTIFFGEISRLHDIALPEHSLKDIYSPAIVRVRDEHGNISVKFANERAKKSALEIYAIDEDRMNQLPAKLNNAYTAETLCESLTSYLDIKLTSYYDQYQAACTALANEAQSIQNDIKHLNEEKTRVLAALSNKKKDPSCTDEELRALREEKGRIEDLIAFKQARLEDPWITLMSQFSKLLQEFNIDNVDYELIFENYDSEPSFDLILKPRAERMRLLYARAAESLSTEGYITGIEVVMVSENCVLLSTSNRQWLEDPSGQLLSMDAILNLNINPDTLTDRTLINAMLDKLKLDGHSNSEIAERLLQRDRRIKLEHNQDQAQHITAEFIVDDFADLNDLLKSLGSSDVYQPSEQCQLALLNAVLKILPNSPNEIHKLINDSSSAVGMLIMNHWRTNASACALKAVNDAHNKFDQAAALSILHAASRGWGESLAFMINNSDFCKKFFTSNLEFIIKNAVNSKNTTVLASILNQVKDDSMGAAVPLTKTILLHAMIQNDIPMISVLLNAKHIKWDLYYVLDWTIKHQSVDILKVLLEKFSTFNIRGAREYTALIEACRIGNTEIVKLLIAKGVSINRRDATDYVKNSGGNTALMTAAQVGNLEIIELLIKNGVDLEEPLLGDKGPIMSPLTAALEKGHNSVSLSLIEAGANVNPSKHNAGDPSPLGHAIYYSKWAVIDAMMKKDLVISNQERLALIEKIVNTPQNLINPDVHKRIIAALAFVSFDDSPNEELSKSFSAMLLNAGIKTSYAALINNAKVHTLSAFYGHAQLCQLADIEIGSDPSLRLYAAVQLARLVERAGPNPNAKTQAQMQAFTRVVGAQDGMVAQKLADALNITRPRYTRMFSNNTERYIPPNTPPEITTAIKLSLNSGGRSV